MQAEENIQHLFQECTFAKKMLAAADKSIGNKNKF